MSDECLAPVVANSQAADCDAVLPGVRGAELALERMESLVEEIPPMRGGALRTTQGTNAVGRKCETRRRLRWHSQHCWTREMIVDLL